MWQRWLIATIKRHRKPMSFEQIRQAALKEAGNEDGKVPPSPARSMRRALHGLVRDGFIVALGTGGRAEPHRYFPSPFFMGMSCDNLDEYNAIVSGLDERDLVAMQDAVQRIMSKR